MDRTACFIELSELAGQTAGLSFAPKDVERSGDSLEHWNEVPRVVIFRVDVENRRRP